ncbi:hypothetical protein ACMZOO_11490 [Catenovulum sp. SX2]|uniref:HzsA-related protein n=1 Tax=Catenovulum sp. SX2 TaxID=3398614 RepID=UPI003F848DCE
MILRWLLSCLCIFYCFSLAHAQSTVPAVDYDIVYVRYPAADPDQDFVTIPQGEQEYKIAGGADLILLKADGTQRILVDCQQCSVMDPYVSYDGKWVYYSLIEQAANESASWLYKINLELANSKPIRLTFDDGFDSALYAGNSKQGHDLSSYRGIRDMAPVPLSNGKLLFTSNRAGLVALNSGTDAVVAGSVQQLYIMDDHFGELTNKRLANIQRLETGNIHTVQHPMQLMNGEILFSSWQDVGHKFRYAMTSLFTVNPDGTNLKQFTEPHYRNKFLHHFITQLPNEDVISALYYPSFDYGYGVIARYPFDPIGPDYIRETYSEDKLGHRDFARKGAVNLTPHSTPRDIPSPDRSGKYSMPSIAKNGELLVAYSTGSVNYFGAACEIKNQCEHLKSGIYLIKDPVNTVVTHPSQLVRVIDEPEYNEIWPRAVLDYKTLYGLDKPQVQTLSMKPRVSPEATAIVGTSSMYNREPLTGNDVDPFQSRSSNRELHDGNWTIQGAEAGVFTNSDIYAVRIVGTPAKPYTQPINKYRHKQRWQQIIQYLPDDRLDKVVARYASFHGEKWQILGEFPLIHKQNGLIDLQNNLDTSWQAKIPAETPFLIQALDKNGMTLISEMTWRALKPGEKRVDCGGCHAHSISSLDFDSTATGKGRLLSNIMGLDELDPRISQGTWDLTSGSIPVLAEQGVQFIEKRVLDVEFVRDVYPILTEQCSSCHQRGGQLPVLQGAPYTVYENLTKSSKTKFVVPQVSRYIRSPQARQSLLVWVAYNQRLDGRTNYTRSNDIDYPESHPKLFLSDIDKRTIARWVDLGGPLNFPQTDGFGYTDDSQLPIIDIVSINKAFSSEVVEFTFAIHDANSGIAKDSLNIEFFQVKKFGQDSELEKIFIPKSRLKINNSLQYQSVYSLSLPSGYFDDKRHYIFEVQVEDKSGNKQVQYQRFSLADLAQM